MSAGSFRTLLARLARDPLLWAFNVTGALILALKHLPVLPPDAVAMIDARSDLVMLALVALVIVGGLRSLPSREERLFWLLLTAGLGSWFVVELSELLGLFGFEPSRHELVRTILFVGLYVFLCSALELKPHHVHGPSDRWRWRRRLEAAGVVVLGLGLLTYFSLLPQLLSASGEPPLAPTSLLYASFDAYVLVRMLQLRATTDDRSWRTVYALLAGAIGTWLLVDLTECAYLSGWLSEPLLTRTVNLLWLPPYPLFAAAARWRWVAATAGLDVTPIGTQLHEGRSAWAIWRRPLWLGAIVLPVVHYALSAVGALDPLVAAGQQACSLVTFLILAAMAVFDQKRLEAENSRLELETAEARQAELRAHHDPLTGLANRFLLLDHLDLALAQARRDGTRVGIVYLDLDRFKVVNASLGHLEGDQVLRAVAGRLQGSVRASDTLGRVGGDEFVLVAPGLASGEQTQVVVDKLLAELRRPFQVKGLELFVRASAGVAVFPDDGEVPNDLLRRADRSMMRAKEQGGDRLVQEDHVESGEVGLLDLETALRKGVDDGAFELLYQPIFDIESGELRACEALLRWDHVPVGRLAPAEFLDTAESIGVMACLTPWLLQRACRTAATWNGDTAGPSVSVNLSARQFLDPALLEHVAAALAETGLPGERLQLEITESIAMAHPERMAQVLSALRGIGASIAIDDFGTGHSSLAALHLLPIDTLKIDASFVRRLDGASGAVIVKAILAMAQALGLSAVAEGVETEEQLATLRSLGCRYAQGFLFARPLEAESLPEILARPRHPAL